MTADEWLILAALYIALLAIAWLGGHIHDRRRREGRR